MALVSLGDNAPFATMQPVSVSHAKILPSAWMPHVTRSLSSGEKARHATPSSCSDSLNSSLPLTASQSTTSALTPVWPVAMSFQVGDRHARDVVVVAAEEGLAPGLAEVTVHDGGTGDVEDAVGVVGIGRHAADDLGAVRRRSMGGRGSSSARIAKEAVEGEEIHPKRRGRARGSNRGTTART